jgi:hypothetical protein
MRMDIKNVFLGVGRDFKNLVGLEKDFKSLVEKKGVVKIFWVWKKFPRSVKQTIKKTCSFTPCFGVFPPKLTSCHGYVTYLGLSRFRKRSRLRRSGSMFMSFSNLYME